MSTKEPIDLAQFEGHTPGPWTLLTEENGDIVIVQPANKIGDPVEYYVAQIVTGGIRKIYFTNARLLASAPELLAELRERRSMDAELNAARAVVAAARKLLDVGGSGNVAQLRAALAAHDALVDQQHPAV